VVWHFSRWPDQVVALQEKVTQNQGMVVKLAREGIFDAMKRSLNVETVQSITVDVIIWTSQRQEKSHQEVRGQQVSL